MVRWLCEAGAGRIFPRCPFPAQGAVFKACIFLATQSEMVHSLEAGAWIPVPLTLPVLWACTGHLVSLGLSFCI